MSYQRVLPRDAFNEAKLLKCLGRLALLTLDNPAVRIEHENPEQGFSIDQDQSSGEIFFTNVCVTIHERVVHLRSGLNSRENYPLQFSTEDCGGFVFTETGDWHPDFLEILAPDSMDSLSQPP